MEKKERIKKLQMLNRRRLLLGEMQRHIKGIDIDDFMSLEKTNELQMKTFEIMERLDATNSSIIKPLNTIFRDLFIENAQSLSEYREEKLAFFHKQSMSIGAIEIDVNTVLYNINYIISESELYTNGCRIFLVNRDERFGLCLWKGEYDIRIYKWG